MTTPKWLVPVLAIVAALAVAVAGVLIGQRLAPQDDAVATPSGTAVVPVLAPVADDPAGTPAGEPTDPGGDSGDSGGGASAGIPVSQAVAEREIALPGSDPDGIDPSLTALVDALAESGDPVFTLMEYDAASDGEHAGTGDDPCAPRDGDPGEECPDGLQSTVLSLAGIADFRAGGQAFPPTREEFLEHGNRLGGSIYCDGLEPAGDEVPFGIVSTAPGTFSVRYWPSERPAEVHEIEGITSSGADLDGFQEALDAGEDPLAAIGMPRHCFTLTGIEPGIVYTAVVSGVDVLDRISEPHTLRFNSAGAPVRPGAQISTVGDNLVFVAAPHTREQTAEARVLLVEGEATPTCAIPEGGGRSLHPLTDVEAEIDDETLVDLNIRADYNRKRVQTFVVPEGSTALVCVRWYASGPAPSWEREQPIFESSAVLQSPDRVLPSARVDAIDGYTDDLASIRVEFATAEGTPCGIPVTWRPDGDLDLPMELCGAFALRSAGVRSTADRLWDVGFAGDLVATFTARLDSGSEAQTRYLIPGRDGGCRGSCEVPERQRYVVALDAVIDPVGLCGSVFGSGCTAPTRDVATGTVELSVGWEQGASNGRATWNVTPTVDVAPEYERPDAPQLDLDARWTVQDLGRRSYTSASFPLRVDRPVDYTMRLRTIEGGAAPSCAPGEGALKGVSGSTASETRVSVSGLCAGEVYLAELELTDEAGNSVVWGLTDRDSWWGDGARVSVPGIDVTISYQLRAQGYTRSYLPIARFQVGGSGVDLTRTLGHCDADGVIATTGSFDATLAGWTNRVVLTIQMQSSGNWSEEDCARSLDGAPAATASVAVTYEDLTSPEGVRIEAPEVFGATLVLQARPAS